MARAFTTVYSETMKLHPIQRRKPKTPIETYYSRPPLGDQDMWLAEAATDKERMKKYSMDDLRELVLQLQLIRLQSEYIVQYHKKPSTSDDQEEESKDGGNELLEYGNRLYADKIQKIMKPMATSRKLFGYLRPKRMYTDLTTYQADIGKKGYEVLKRNTERCLAHQAAIK